MGSCRSNAEESTTGLQDKQEEVRNVISLSNGKSKDIQKKNRLILGWSEKLGSLLKQLAMAGKSGGGGVAVVLAEGDEEEMEMDIAKLEFDFMQSSNTC